MTESMSEETLRYYPGIDPIIADVAIPSHRLSAAEYRHWRNICYRRGEEKLIRQFFASQSVVCPKDPTVLWIWVHTAIRIMTWTLIPYEAIYAPYSADHDEDNQDLLSIDGMACKAQFFLDRHGIEVLPHKAAFKQRSLITTLPRSFYDVPQEILDRTTDR